MGESTFHMYYSGICWLCEAGLIGVRACGECGQLSLLCDECDSLWIDPDIAASPFATGTDQLPCPFCGASLFESESSGPSAHWATAEEIASCPWLSSAVENKVLRLERFPPAGEEPPRHSHLA